MSVWYRSKTPDGKVWCESSYPSDVSEDDKTFTDLTFEKKEVYRVTEGWVEWEI